MARIGRPRLFYGEQPNGDNERDSLVERRVVENRFSPAPLIKPCMRFSRTRLSDVLHVKACALARLTFISAAKDVAPAHSTIECVTIGRFLFGLGIQLPL